MKKGEVFVFFALGMLCALSEVRAQSWPSFGGPSFDGTVREGLPRHEGEWAFELRYKRPLGVGYSSVSVEDGLAVTAYGTEGRDFVGGFDAKTGTEMWRFDLGPIFRGKDGVHDGPASTPLIVESRVFALDPDGRFVALDATDGRMLWQHDLPAVFDAPKTWYACSSPVFFSDKVLLRLGGKAGVLALHPSTGRTLWQSFLEVRGCSSVVPVNVGGEDLLLVVGVSGLYGLRPEDGTIALEVPNLGVLDQNASPLPLSSAVGSSADAVLLRLEQGRSLIVALGRTGGGFVADRLHELRTLSRTYSPPAFWDGKIFGYTSRFISAVDPVSGRELWRSRAPGDGWSVIVDGQLIAATKEGSLAIGPASTEGFEISSTVALFDDLVWSPPSFAEGSLFVRSHGELARVDLVPKTGESPTAESARLPATLAALRARVEGRDPDGVISEFLADKQLPLVDGDQALFLWHGEASDVGIAGDMLGMKNEDVMNRLEGTDLWWWQTELDPRARMAYNFVVDFEPVVDPLNPRRDRSALLGPHLGWIELETGRFLERSWFSMPEAPSDPAYVEPVHDGAPRGHLEEVPLTMEFALHGAQPEEVPVPLRVWLPPGYEPGAEYPVAFVHAAFAVSSGRWPNALDHLVGGDALRPMIVVFLEPPYFLGPVYASQFRERVLPVLDARYRFTKDRSLRAHIGMGNEALFAGLVAFSDPTDSGLLGLQSLMGTEDTELGWVADELAEIDTRTTPFRVYHDWGQWDLHSPLDGYDKRELGPELNAHLERQGISPVGGEVVDSTDWWSWRSRIGDILLHLFSE